MLALAAVLGCALLWRLPVTDDQWRFTLCENDSLYQLHRVENCLQRYPLVESVDPYSHYPRVYRVPWMPLHTVFYATVAKLAGVSSTQREALVALLSWIPPLMGLLALALVLAITRCFTSNPLCIFAVGLLCAFSTDVCRPFFYGAIDHHLFAHLGVLLMVWGRLRQRLSAWIAGLLSLLAMTPEGIVYVTALMACILASELAALTSGQRTERRTWSWLLSPGAVAFAVWLAGRFLDPAPLPIADLTWTYPTLFSPLWFTVLGTSMDGALLGAVRLGRVKANTEPNRAASAAVAREAAPVSVAAAFAAITAVALAGAAFLLWTGALQTTVARLFGGGQRLFVAEEASVFRVGFWEAAVGYRILALAAIYVAVKLAAALRSGCDSTGSFQWLVLAVSLGLGLAEYRHLYVLSSLQLVALGLAAFEIETRLRRLPIFSGRARVIPAVILALAIVPSFAAENLADRAATSGDVCTRLPLLETLAGWLKHNTPDPGSGPKPGYGVFSAWTNGHHLHILGERPVVVDPFNYELDRGVEEALDRVWHARGADQMTSALRAYGVRYLVLTNPEAEILGTIEAAGLRRDDLEERSPGGKVTFKPAMSQFASFRLFMGGRYTGEFGQLQPRYFTADAEHYTANSSGAERQFVVPRGQIYELKPGALISGAIPEGADRLTVQYQLRLGGADAIDIAIPLATDAEGRFAFRTSLPAPSQEESFAVTGGYKFTAGDRSRVVLVTQDMVDAGTVVPLRW